MRKKMISLMMTVAMGTVMISGATVVKADSDEKETVKLAVWSSGAADNFQKGADEFNKRQDKINFVVEMQSGDYSQYLGAKVASNDLPDMFLPESIYTGAAVCSNRQNCGFERGRIYNKDL